MLLLASSMSIITRGFQRGFCLFLKNSKHTFLEGKARGVSIKQHNEFEISISLWVFWICCKNLISVKFTIMESLKLSWISLDKYFLYFFPIYYLILLPNFIISFHFEELYSDVAWLKSSSWFEIQEQHFVNAWLFNKNLSHLNQGWVEFW